MRKPDDFSQKRVNTTEISRRYSDEEIKDLIGKDLIARAAVRSASSKHTIVAMMVERDGLSGQTFYAEVKVIVDHDPPAKEETIRDPL